MTIETAPESPTRRSGPAAAAGGELPRTVESGALRLLACAASVVLLVCLLILPTGPSESDETLSWLLAFAVALPAGMVVAAYQARRLANAGPAATARGLAAGMALLALAFSLRRIGAGDRLHHALLALAALGALAAPLLAAQRWRHPDDRSTGAALAVGLASLAVIVLLFVPGPALHPAALVGAAALAALALLLLRLGASRSLSGSPRLALDAVLCGIIALGVIQLPDIVPFAPDLVHHQSFFLGPANDVLHGRAMLGSAWSQYGVGLIDSLALAFTVVPIGFGVLALIVVAATTAQYVCVYATLRLAGLGQALAVLTIVVAALGNLFSPLDVYPVFPSDSALRFGLPYLIVLCAVVGTRFPAQARTARVATLVVLAIGAVWSFETFVYCGATYGALVLVEALCAGTGVVRRVIRGAALGLGASAAAVLLFSALTLAFNGHLDWGPYIEYLRLYTVGGFGQLPVVFFSAGPLMAAAIFTSAVTLLWLARERPWVLAPPIRAALAGFTGLAVATFTYYLGRSHPNNLLVLLPPVVALGGLWTQVLLRRPAVRWRTAAAAVLLLAGATIAVASWPSVERKAGSTALALALPRQGGSLRLSFDTLKGNPVLDPRAPAAAALLDRLPPGAPAAVLTEPELTTEVLMRAGRRNLLPISDPNEDVLIGSSRDRVRAAVARIAAGTLLLTSPAPNEPGEVAPTGLPRGFNELQEVAVAALHRRFHFRLIQRDRDGIELVRLVPRGRASPASAN